MADPKAIQFLEGLYSRVDKQVRDIVTSMLPGVTIAAQDDGTVIANDHRILNFQGPGVTVSDESARRRVNVYVPGAPVASATTTVNSTTTAKARSLWTGSANSAPPSGWETPGFSDASWSNAVSAAHGTLAPISGTTGLWPSTSPVALAADHPSLLTASASGTFGPATYSAITPTYYPNIPSGGGFTTYTFTATCHDSSGGLMQCGFIAQDASGTQLNLGVPGTGGLSDGQTATVTCGPSGSAFSGNFSTADHFAPYVSGYGDGFQTGSFDWTLTWDGTPPVVGLPGEQALIRQTFTLPAGTIATATLDVNAEAHLLGIYVNGNFVSGSITDPGSSTLHFTIPPANLITGGSNLIAINAQNYTSSPDYAWVAFKLTTTTSSPGTDTQYIPKSIITTKGDLIVGASSANPVRQGVGTDGYVLTARSTATNGIAWEAGGGGGGSTDFVLAQHVELSSNTASVRLPTSGSFATTYRTLRLSWDARSTASANSVGLALQVNGDTGSHYLYYGMFWANTGPSLALSGNPATSGIIGEISAATTDANASSSGEVSCHNYSNTLWYKKFRADGFLRQGGTAIGNNYVAEWWLTPAAAVSYVTLFPVTGSFLSGSVFAATLEGKWA
jgi:hypothetical protein